MTITFGGVAMSNPTPLDIDRQPIVNTTILLSGKRAVQASAELGFGVSFVCKTQSTAEIAALRGKIGTAATLSIDGTPVDNCYINAFREREISTRGEIWWEYEIGFVQDTSL